MTDYLYDGSFPGLLTCVYEHYYGDRASGIYTKENYQQTLLNSFRVVETDEEKANRVAAAVEKKISGRALRSAYRAWLSSVPGREMTILNYLVLGFRKGPSVDSLRGEEAVFALQSILKKISVEKERMLQFVRFSEMGSPGHEILYAEVEPAHDVLELIGEHFADRFSTEAFIIRDVERNKAIVSAGGSWYMAEDFSPDKLPEFTGEEEEFRRLWRTYYDHIGISERRNEALRRKFMPLRYARHLTELQG